MPNITRNNFNSNYGTNQSPSQNNSHNVAPNIKSKTNMQNINNRYMQATLSNSINVPGRERGGGGLVGAMPPVP